MSDLGQMLKKARMENKISLDDLSDSTKIRKRYLEAIEEGNYKVLPGNFYVKAFIKNYAEAVGLDPFEVLQLYQTDNPAAEVEPVEPIRGKRMIRNTENFGKWASTAVIVSFVVLILGGIYYFISLNYGSGSKDTNGELPKTITDKIQPEQKSQVPDKTAPASVENKKTETVSLTPAPSVQATDVKLVKSERGTDFYTVTHAEKLNIDMNVTGDACWIQLETLGEKRQIIDQGTYQNGSVKTWDLKDPVYFIFGKANAAQLRINGTTVIVGDAPNVKKIQIDIQKQ